MSKVIKVDHVILTLALNSAAQSQGGLSKQEIDNMINVRLAEGYDEFVSHFIRTNYDERQQATHAVILYIFKKYEAEIVTQAGSTGKLVKDKKEKEPVA